MSRLVLILFLLLPGISLAQVVTIRSGQHEGFARLVLTFPEPAGWDFGRTDDGYAFRVRGAPWRYDMSTVFNYIPRDRLSAIWVDPASGVLRLGLACHCHAIATPFRQGIVVVDIADGDPPAGSPYERALAGSGADMPRLTSRPMQRPMARPRDFRPPAPTRIELHPPTRISEALRPNLAREATDPRFRSLEVALTQALREGIMHGSVAPVTPQAQPRRPVILPAPPDPDTVQLRSLEPTSQRHGLGSAGVGCFSDERLDISSWNGTGSPLDQIGGLRAQLITGDGQVDSAAFNQLARLYLYLGFGSEAQELVSTAPETSDHKVLAGLAAVMDGQQTEAFLRMEECDGPAALWAALSRPEALSSGRANVPAIIRSFAVLPRHLRLHLGHQLAERFLSTGNPNAARHIRDAIERGQTAETAAVTVLDARMAADPPTPQVAAQLEQVAQSRDSLAPQALANLVELNLRRGLPADQDSLSLLESMLVEHRGGSDEAIIRRTLARGLVLTNDYRRAFEDLGGADSEILPGLWDLLAAHGDRTILTEMALTASAEMMRGVSITTRGLIARNLLAAGFPDAALVWASPLRGPEVDLMRAEAALASGDGRTALRQLAGQDAQAAHEIRAKSLMQLGDFAAAAESWAAAGDPLRAQHSLFLARRWDQLPTDTQTPVVVAATQLTLNAAADLPPLAAGAALVQQSTQTREAIERLLSNFTQPQ